MRITRPQMYMQIARVASQRSTCMRLNVGAVIVSQRHLVSIGYNGAPTGQQHCTGNKCPGKHVCHLTIHAEENAIHFASQPLLDADMYTTDSPCQHCARLISESGIKRLFFETPYRITESLDYLRDKNVKVYQVTPAGYTMDWFTNELVEVVT